MSEDEEDSELPSKSKNFDTSASTPNLLPSSSHGKSPHNKRRGLSETPEIQRKSRKLFAARTRDVDKLQSGKGAYAGQVIQGGNSFGSNEDGDNKALQSTNAAPKLEFLAKRAAIIPQIKDATNSNTQSLES